MIEGTDLVRVILEVIAIGAVCGLLWWLVRFLKIPAPFDRVAVGIIAVFGVLFLINVIFYVMGHPFIHWGWYR